jgi:hypothetical protein
MLGRDGLRRALLAALVFATASNAFAAEGGVWSVSRASGDVWVATDGAQQVSLNQEGTLKPGDTIRTGSNGRVLLVRGEETILISPNSVVGLPTEKKEGLSTTIVQQAGSILLEVEKRNVKHFEVETPYLAAVVKGTQFSVTVNAGSTKVGVLRGQVEVSDFKTGQIAQVMPGQAATAFERGKSGLSLSGSGTFNPIEQGKPRASTIDRIPVPRSGLSAPRNTANGRTIHALGHIDKGAKAAGSQPKSGVVRISSSLGDVKLNFHKVTNGLARGPAVTSATRNASTSNDTIWSDSKTGTTTAASNSANQTAATSSSSATSGSSSSSVTTTVATTAGSSSDANGSSGGGNGNSGNGNSGNGNGNGSGATGNGKGNNGNGNGNGGGNGSNGQGNAYGRNRH